MTLKTFLRPDYHCYDWIADGRFTVQSFSQLKDLIPNDYFDNFTLTWLALLRVRPIDRSISQPQNSDTTCVPVAPQHNNPCSSFCLPTTTIASPLCQFTIAQLCFPAITSQQSCLCSSQRQKEQNFAPNHSQKKRQLSSKQCKMSKLALQNPSRRLLSFMVYPFQPYSTDSRVSRILRMPMHTVNSSL